MIAERRLDAPECVAPQALSTGSTAACALDRAALAENTMSDLALQKELFDLYFAQAPSYLSGMRDALAIGDQTGWSAAAHSLKGTARTLGLMRLAGAAAEAEASTPEAPLLLAVDDEYVGALAAAYAYLADA